MSQDLIIESITKYIPLSDADKQCFLGLLHTKTYKKKAAFTKGWRRLQALQFCAQRMFTGIYDL